jgi:hypothetical protein
VIWARLNRGHWEILVLCQGQASTDATWEKVADFKIAYPAVQLEYKLFLEEEENVVDSFIMKVYKRRRQARTLIDIEL